jgi:hypothetical protein
VVDYIDGLLGAMHHDAPRIYAGGPFSDRAGAKTDDMAAFLPLSDAVRAHWEVRVAGLLAAYRAGIRKLDQLADGDFAKAAAARQDAALAKNPKVPRLPADATGFTDLLFRHAIEGCYAVPEYGGNTGLVGWKEIKFPGDRQPKGFTDAEVRTSDGPDVLKPTGVVDAALKLVTATAPGSPNAPTLVGPGR